jgi:hypothetical protein
VTEIILAFVYLLVSIESVAIQVVSLLKLRGGTPDPVHKHLVRTVGCRVGVMTSYVGIAIANILTHNVLSVPALAEFIAVTLVWQVNSLADVRLRRNMANGGPRMVPAALLSDLAAANARAAFWKSEFDRVNTQLT